MTKWQNPDPPPEVRITRREAKAMLASGGWRKDAELTKASMMESYVNDRGQALSLLPGSRAGAKLCDDRAALMRWILAARALPPRHILEGLFPFGESFPEEVPELIAQLAADAKLAPSDLDASVESLQKVERALRRKPGPRSWMTEARFPPLVAYVGEVIRTARMGEWKMEFAYGHWEPWIVGAGGRRFAPFLIVYEELERGRGGSIWGATRGTLKAERFFGPRKGSN